MQEMWVWSLGQENTLEEKMANNLMKHGFPGVDRKDPHR